MITNSNSFFKILSLAITLFVLGSCSQNEDDFLNQASWELEYDILKNIPVPNDSVLTMHVKELYYIDNVLREVEEKDLPLAKVDVPTLFGGLFLSCKQYEKISYKLIITAPDIPEWQNRTDSLEVAYTRDFLLEKVLYNHTPHVNLKTEPLNHVKDVKIRIFK